MSTNKNAICKFCGQYFIDVIMPNSATEEECLESGTLKCHCSSATLYQRRKDQALKAKLELNSIAQQDTAHNIKGIDGDAVKLLENSIDIISEDKIHSIKVGLCSGGDSRN